MVVLSHSVFKDGETVSSGMHSKLILQSVPLTRFFKMSHFIRYTNSGSLIHVRLCTAGPRLCEGVCASA